MFKRLLSPPEQSRAAKTVEILWLDHLPRRRTASALSDFMASLMHFGPLAPQASDFLRLIGMLISGFGMLYLLSGRLNAEGFVFATLIDRPFVATMATLYILRRCRVRWRSYLPSKIPQAGSGLY